MKRKPIRVDWDELEVAFNNRNDELVYFLDLVTGHVVLEGEGEEDDFDDEDDYQKIPSASPAPAAPRDDSTRAYVHPVSVEAKLKWMEAFLDGPTELDDELATRLREAIGAEDPAQALGDLLRENAEARDQWYLFRSERTREMIDEWLKSHEVEAIEPPPWES